MLLEKGILQRKLNAPREGPYEIQGVYTNGVVKLKKGAVAQKVSIRRIVPYSS